MDSTLPEQCMIVHGLTNRVSVVRRGVVGHFPVETRAVLSGEVTAAEFAETHNECHGVTPQQAAAMLSGSIFGFDVPFAHADRYTEADGRTLAYGVAPEKEGGA